MIVKLPNTTTNDIDKRITSLRNEDGAIALGRMLTLVTAPDTGDIVEDSIEAATGASREHPCRTSWLSQKTAAPPRHGWMGNCAWAVTPGPSKLCCCAPLRCRQSREINSRETHHRRCATSRCRCWSGRSCC